MNHMKSYPNILLEPCQQTVIISYHSPVGEHKAVGCQPLVPGVQNCIQHGLVEQAVTHPLGDNDVHLVNSLWQAHLKLSMME